MTHSCFIHLVFEKVLHPSHELGKENQRQLHLVPLTRIRYDLGKQTGWEIVGEGF